MMRRFTEREQDILIVTLGVVFFAIVYNGVVGSLLKKVELLDRGIERLQAQWGQEKAMASRAKMINVKFDAYLSLFGRSVTKEEAMSAALSEIESVARQLGVQVTELKSGQTFNGGYEKQFSISVTSNSEFLKVVQFLYELQQDPYFFNVDGLIFEQSARSDETLMTSRLVLTKAFISPEEENPHE